MVPVFFLRVKSRRVAYVALSRSLGSVGWGPTYSGWPPADRGGARSDRRRAQWLVEGVERSGAVGNGHSVLPDRTWSPSHKVSRFLA